MLWDAEIAEFGRAAEYWPRGEASQGTQLMLLWSEGVEGEERSPGRYSHARVRNSDISGGPQQGDIVVDENGVQYDVVRVDAFITGHSGLVLQDRTETF